MSVCVSGRRDKTEGANCGGVGGGGDGGAIVIGPYIRDCPGSHQTRGKEGRKGKGKGKGDAPMGMLGVRVVSIPSKDTSNGDANRARDTPCASRTSKHSLAM